MSCYSKEIINRIWGKMPWGEIFTSLKVNGKTLIAHQWDKDFVVHVRIEIEFNFSTCENLYYVVILFGFNSLLFLQAKLQLKSLVSCNQWEFFLRRTFCEHCTICSFLLFIFWPFYCLSYGRIREIGSSLELSKMKRKNRPWKRSKH